MTTITATDHLSPQAAYWRHEQLEKSHLERLVGRVLAVSAIKTTLCAAYSLLSEPRRERFMRWLSE